MNISYIINQQRLFFKTNQTLDIHYRIQTIKRIQSWIIQNESLICDALMKDLHKSETESYMCEIGMTLSDISYQLKHIKSFSKPKKVRSPLAQFPCISYEYKEPYGLTLVMSPWNYPFLLCLQPAIGAIAAGNTVIIKPSEFAPYTSQVVSLLIKETCDERHVCVIEGNQEVSEELLNHRFDFIFFTGSPQVGKIVYEKASHFLTPVTLELGGKSPCIVNDKDYLKLAAKRIAFGKFLNAGQTCVAPDYILVKEDLKDSFIEYVIEAIHDFFNDNPLDSSLLVHIINERHFNRLIRLLEDQDIVYGGRFDKEKHIIEPTIIDHIDLNSDLMKEEIFGPLMPVLTYQNIDDAIEVIHQFEKPLALYLFSSDKKVQEKVLLECHFGGGCINDTIIHLATDYLGFGGVGESGIGVYHGKHSFNTFSHTKSIIKKSNWIDLPIRYYPFNSFKKKMIHFFMK